MRDLAHMAGTMIAVAFFGACFYFVVLVYCATVWP